jgi:uncharacterized membrane protein
MTRRMMLYGLAFSLVLALPLLAVTYNFTTINPFNSVETSARGINNHGDVVGDFATAAQESAGTESGFLLHNGNFTQINFPGANDTDANGINNHGVIVGTYDDNSGDHGYVWSEEDGYTALPDPANQDGRPDFNAINDHGDVVGVLVPQPPTLSNGNLGFLFSEGEYTLIDCGGWTEANGINNDGDIVGECGHGSPTQTSGFLLRDGTFSLIDFPAAVETVALGINGNGDIVGTYLDSSSVEHAFVLRHFPEEPQWTAVDAPGSTDTKVAGINNHRQLVGTASTTAAGNQGFKAKRQED